MKMTLLILFLAGCPLLHAQQTSRADKKAGKETVDQSFEAYCLENALTVMTIPSSKQAEFSGTVTFKEGATYKDYGIVLLEEKTQYFRIEGTDKMLVATSLFRLRTAYSSKH